MAISHAHKSCWIVIFLFLLWGNCGYAAGLGALHLHPSPGKPLQASMQLSGTGIDEPNARCVKARLDEEHREMQTLLKNLHTEAVALRAEAERMSQQNLAYRNTLDATHEASLNWIKGLASLLAVCFATVGWLLWRMLPMKRAAAQPSHTPYTVPHTETPDTELLASRTESALPEPCKPEIDDEPDAAPNTATAPLPASGKTVGTEMRAHIPAATPGQRIEVPAIDESAAFVPAPRLGVRAAHKEEELASGQLLKAGEISDVMELVNAWMTLNAPDKVLELLRPFNDVEQPESPLPWLCLLDVYRAIGDQEKYEAILRRIKTLFNVKLAPWNAQCGHEQPKTLLDFPHVIDEISTLWQTTAIIPYLENLLHDNRNGTRHGFDLPAYHDILQLIALAREPGRMTRCDQAMPEQVQAILFGSREQTAQTTVIASSPSVHEHATESAVAEKAANSLTHDQPGTASCTDAPAALEQLRASINPDDLSPIAIKLHLAIAYQDIGDNEGASLLLDEVIHDGNEEQSKQARLMLAKLA